MSRENTSTNGAGRRTRPAATVPGGRGACGQRPSQPAWQGACMVLITAADAAEMLAVAFMSVDDLA
jgi:hypothetical protein